MGTARSLLQFGDDQLTGTITANPPDYVVGKKYYLAEYPDYYFVVRVSKLSSDEWVYLYHEHHTDMFVTDGDRLMSNVERGVHGFDWMYKWALEKTEYFVPSIKTTR